jgi:hypothetical protein
MHSQGKTNTAPAARALRQKFEREVDPDGVLPAAERAKRAEFARKRFYTELARRANKVRWGKRDAKAKEVSP